MTGSSRAIALVGIVVFVGACTSLRTPNVAIDRIDSESGYRPHAHAGHRGSGDVWLLVTFSGGGTRAAAFAYGVLEELAATQVEVDGEPARLLDEVDAISGVSGGSFPAAYYGLFGDRVFEEFEPRFLRRNVEGSLILRALAPWNFVMLMTPALSRTDIASDFYSKHVFDGATYAALEQASGPQVFINSTDLTEGTRFTFTQDGFDVICSDLSSFPIAAATAASSAVPGLLSPLTLRNYAGRCGFEPPAWFEAALRSRETDPPRYRAADSVVPYLEPKQKAFIHLVDGGIADNLGLRVGLDRIEAVGGVEAFRELEGWEPPDHIIVIVVDAQTEPNPKIDLRAAAPGLIDTLGLVSGAQIRRINYDTLDILWQSMARWTIALSTADRKVTGHVVEVSFDLVPNADEREQLKRLPTSFHLDDDEIDLLIEAARQVLRASPQFREALDAL